MENIVKKPAFWVVIVFLVIVGAAIFQIAMDEEGVDFTREGDEEVALRVNDTTYTFEEFRQTFEQVAMDMQMQGMQVTKEEVKDTTKERLVQEALLIEYATSEGIEVTRSDMEEHIEELMGMIGVETEEELLGQLEAEGIENREELEEILEREILIMNLIDAYAEEVDITDEEAEDAYDEYAEQMEMFGGPEDVPTFEEMEGEIKEGLAQEEVFPLLFAKLEELEEEADIEIFITKDDLEFQEIEAPEGQAPMMDPEDMEDLEIEMEESDMEDTEDMEGMEIEMEEPQE